MEQTFTIQEVAEITGLSVHTLRYYERIGLLDPVNRKENGYRRYSAMDVAWVEFLNRLRVTGMPIRSMQEFASLRRKGDVTVRERRELLEQHERNFRARMEELTRNLSEIQKKIGLYKEMESKHDTKS